MDEYEEYEDGYDEYYEDDKTETLGEWDIFTKKGYAIPADKIWQDKVLLRNGLRIGLELESAHIRNCESIAEELHVCKFNENGNRMTRCGYKEPRYRNYDEIGNEKCPEGVVEVYNDGTIESGYEIVFTGSAEPFHILHDRLSKVESVIKKHSFGMVHHPSCGMHMTMINVPHKSLPLIYAVNFSEYVRRHLAQILWMCSGVFMHDRKSKYRIYRGGCYGDAKEFLEERNPTNFRNLRVFVMDGNHEDLVNLEGLQEHKPSSLSQEKYDVSSVNKFVIEFRIPDRITVPSATVALMQMAKAMLLRAVDLSEFGLLKAKTDEEYWKTMFRISNKISKFLQLDVDDIRWLQKEASLLIDDLVPTLTWMGAPEAIDVLYNLAVAPVSLRLRESDATPESIETDLYPTHEYEDVTQQIISLIKSGRVRGLSSERAWKKKVAGLFKIDTVELNRILDVISSTWCIDFDSNIGSIVFR